MIDDIGTAIMVVCAGVGMLALLIYCMAGTGGKI